MELRQGCSTDGGLGLSGISEGRRGMVVTLRRIHADDRWMVSRRAGFVAASRWRDARHPRGVPGPGALAQRAKKVPPIPNSPGFAVPAYTFGVTARSPLR